MSDTLTHSCYTPYRSPLEEAIMEDFRSGLLYCGDNLTVMPHLPRNSIDLIYIDPPFFSSRAYEVIFGDSREKRAYDDRWKGGINHYVGWLCERIRWMWELLKPTGSIYVYLDTHAVHYVKVQLDEIFGVSKFRNEIIWKRTSAHSSAHRFGPNFDTILFYTKGDEYTWNPLYQPQDQHYVETHYTGKDEYYQERGPFQSADLTAAGTRQGSSGQPWRGFDPNEKGLHWKFTIDTLEKLDVESRIHWPPRGGWPRYKRYWSEVSKGYALQAIWTDIPPINSQARERKEIGGYPTQKPEALLRRIIEASSNRGDIVADFFCGCGTALAVAQQLQRRWIGCDVSPTALKVVRRRLERVGATEVRLMNYPHSLDELKEMNPFEFENYVIDFINGTHAGRADDNRGIDGFTFMNSKPVQVKQQDRVGGDIVQRFCAAVEGKKKEQGYIFAFGFSRFAYEEAARLKTERGISIELLKVQDAVQQEPQPEFL